MIRVLLSGACGKMGHAVAGCMASDEAFQIVGGIDREEQPLGFPVYHSFREVTQTADVVVDFSHPAVLDSLLEYALRTGTPAVLATTGYSKEQIDKIHEAAKQIPIFFTFNMSLGVNLLCSLAKTASTVLGANFDVEIVEKHHNQKLDAPSGTALMLADAINEVSDDRYRYEYDRHSKRQKRPNNEIGIHSVRGGTIVGEHDVIFAGHDEVITLSHTAFSKEVFAAGAVKAAKYLVGKPAGIYDMKQVVKL